jgi:hypothetical protein
METQRIMNESQQTLQNEQTTPVDENMINPQAGA